jgi:pimeloyl-ACP methyl ester carboxylesterase
VGAATIVDEFLQARWPGYSDRLAEMAPGAFTQAVTDAQTWFGSELAAQLAWQFAEAEARRINQPVLSILGGESEALWDRFGETHRWLLASLPRAEGLVVPHATHFPQFQNPAVLAEGLSAFFARYPLLV